jgi:hypothetical protein
MKKETTINRPAGLSIFCIMLTLGSAGGSIALPIFILAFEGPLIFLPFIEGIFIYNFYLAYNLWNLKKRSWSLVKLWLEILVLFVSYPTVSAAIHNASEEAIFILLFDSILGYFVIGLFGYYLYKERHLFVN